MNTENQGWLPIAICPTDGVWRLAKLSDGTEVAAAFDGIGILAKSRWQTKSFAFHNPARRIERGPLAGQMSTPYDTFLVADMKKGVFPTHFRPNDTIFGPPKGADE